jgi:antirestriction protein ArdC
MTHEQPNNYREALAAPLPSEAVSRTVPVIDVFDAQIEKQRQVLDTLQRGVEGIMTSEGYQAYLKTMAKFHQYSFANSLLIHAQNPDATRVAGYRKWQELGRQVRKGEKAIKIFVPFKRKEIDPDTGEEGYRVTGFGLGNVFDVASTDGEPLPERPSAIESEEVTEVSREVNKRLSRWLIDEGVQMESKEIHGNAKGYWSPRDRKIVIRRGPTEIDEETGEEYLLVDPLNITKTKTLVHEAGHFVANHNGEVDRKDAEVVAESTAFVTMNHFGLDTGDYSFPYLASWAENPQRLRANLSEVQRVSNVLISAIEGTPLEEEPDLT